MTESLEAPTSRSVALGWTLIVYAMLCFGALPLLLKVLITEVDPITLTWYRFIFAGLSIALVSGSKGAARFKAAISHASTRWLIVAAGLGLSANYTLYMSGLAYLTPGTAQIILQVSPFFVVFGGVFLFNEPFTRRQWLGVLILLVGCTLFFNQRLGEFRSLSSAFVTGVGLITLAAVAWAAYVLLQKKLTELVGSRTTMLGCYATGGFILAIAVDHSSIWRLGPQMVAILIVCIAITATSYVAFASSLRHVRASTAGIVIANIPLVTLAASLAVAPYVDRLPLENVNTVALFGALLVVVGSMIGAVPGKTARQPSPD